MGTIWVFVPKNRTLSFDFLKQPNAAFFSLWEVFCKNSCHAKCCTVLPFNSCDQNLRKISAKGSVFNKVATFNFIYLTSCNFTLTVAFWPKLVVASLFYLSYLVTRTAFHWRKNLAETAIRRFPKNRCSEI